MRTIGVVSVGRSDYGIYLPILRQIQQDPSLRLSIYATGMHLSADFGLTVREFEQDGFIIDERVESLHSSDGPEGIAKSIALGVNGFADVFSRSKPDILLVLGDRFEMYAAALAAVPFCIPIAHIHGGELTLGAIDDIFRHSITKMSHLHFVSTDEYAKRVIQLGEESWRVTVSGAPALDNLKTIKFMLREELERKYDIDLSVTPVLVTFHPVTTEFERAEWQLGEIMAALEDVGCQAIFTAPNADTNNGVIFRLIKESLVRNPKWRFVENMGLVAYFSLMREAAVMVGNSSSGIIEAPSFRLPVVNIDSRQDGRIRGRNVIDVSNGKKEDIVKAIHYALSERFRSELIGTPNPYSKDMNAADIIVKKLKQVDLDERLKLKRFIDIR